MLKTMQRVIPLGFFFILVSSILFGANSNVVVRPESQRLESYAGKYPSDFLKAQPSYKRRLRNLLGGNYSAFMTRLQTEMPMEIVEGCLVGTGCMAHSCGSEEAIMVINLSDGKLCCAIRSTAKYNGGYRVFSEDKQHIPHALYRTMESH